MSSIFNIGIDNATTGALVAVSQSQGTYLGRIKFRKKTLMTYPRESGGTFSMGTIDKDHLRCEVRTFLENLVVNLNMSIGRALIECPGVHSKGINGLVSPYLAFQSIKEVMEEEAGRYTSGFLLELVHPGEWQAEMFTAPRKAESTDTKDCSIRNALRYVDGDVLIPTLRSKKPNHDIADAVLIAQYSRLTQQERDERKQHRKRESGRRSRERARERRNQVN